MLGTIALLGLPPTIPSSAWKFSIIIIVKITFFTFRKNFKTVVVYFL